MRIRWSVASVKHLEEIVEFLQGESSGRAVTVRRRILETKRRIGRMPYSGHVGRIEGTREAFVPRTAYIIVYRVAAQTVEILGIWHAARLWPESFEPQDSP